MFIMRVLGLTNNAQSDRTDTYDNLGYTGYREYLGSFDVGHWGQISLQKDPECKKVQAFFLSVFVSIFHRFPAVLCTCSTVFSTTDFSLFVCFHRFFLLCFSTFFHYRFLFFFHRVLFTSVSIFSLTPFFPKYFFSSFFFHEQFLPRPFFHRFSPLKTKFVPPLKTDLDKSDFLSVFLPLKTTTKRNPQKPPVSFRFLGHIFPP